MRRVIGMAAPTQLLQRQTRLDVIEHELAEYELVGAHGAEWFLRPENKAAFFKVSPSGCLYFLHKESVGDMLLGLVCRHQHEGPIAISGFYAEERSKFPPDALFAVIDPAAQPTP
ncbi:TPA: hypothetical protein DEP96_01455 [Candidatus Uhrbacteria bacterium]|nr:hypothetical protein [Candidatus Uhrbacteria bacterium]